MAPFAIYRKWQLKVKKWKGWPVRVCVQRGSDYATGLTSTWACWLAALLRPFQWDGWRVWGGGLGKGGSPRLMGLGGVVGGVGGGWRWGVGSEVRGFLLTPCSPAKNRRRNKAPPNHCQIWPSAIANCIKRSKKKGTDFTKSIFFWFI